jgi:hypothetical protein
MRIASESSGVADPFYGTDEIHERPISSLYLYWDGFNAGIL